MIIIPNEIQISLINRPEYGMGYQNVIATLDTGGRKSGIVVNARVFMNGAERASQEMFDNWDVILDEARKSRRLIVKLI
jgi:hypothetical protein